MELAPGVSVDDDALTAFCRTNGVRRLGLFGSALRGELRPDSDIDLLVEFDTGRVPGVLRLAGLELELAELLGRDVDLRAPGDLSGGWFRDEVSAGARILYDAAQDRVRLAHLREAAEKAVRYSRATSRRELEDDEVLRLGLTKLVEIVGEAAKQVSQPTR